MQSAEGKLDAESTVRVSETTGPIAAAVVPDARLLEFDRWGITTFDGPFTAAQLEAAQRAFDSTPSIASWSPPLPGQDDGKGRYRAITSDPSELTEPLLELISHPMLERTAQDVLRSPSVHILKVTLVSSMPEPADSATSYRFHVDTQIQEPGFDASPRSGLTAAVWCWLSDVENGCANLMIYKGSHRALAHQLDTTRGLSTAVNPSLEQLRVSGALGEFETVSANAGQLTVVTTACLHMASPNRSNVPRRLLIVTFGRIGVDAPRLENAALRTKLPLHRRYLVQAPVLAAAI